jgi:citrate synthase
MMIGIPARLTANMNIIARTCGLCAHIFEQKNFTKKIFIKSQKYIGPEISRF